MPAFNPRYPKVRMAVKMALRSWNPDHERTKWLRRLRHEMIRIMKYQMQQRENDRLAQAMIDAKPKIIRPF